MRDLAQFDRERSSYFLERSQWDRSGEAAILEPEAADGLSSRIRDYWLIFQKHRRLIGIAMLGSVVVCAIVVFFLMTSIYTAETTLLIERNPPQVLALQQELISPEPLVPDEHDFYKTQNEILTSRHLAAEVIHEQHLENSPVLTGRPGPIGWAMAKATWLVNWISSPPHPETENGINPEFIDRYLNDVLEIKPILQTRMVKVLASTPDRKLSARLANAHAQAYIRAGLRLRTKPGEEAQKFLDEKLGELKERLGRSEAALSDFRHKHGIVDNLGPTSNEPGTDSQRRADIVMQRLADLNKLATDAEAELIGLEAQERLIEKGDYDALPVVVNSALIQTLKGQVATLEVNYASLSSRYMPAYPAVQQARAQLDQAKERLSREIKEVVGSIEDAYQSADKKEKGIQAKLEAQKTVALALMDEAVNYALLAREAETNRQLYDNVVQRMKEVGMAAQLRASSVSVIDVAAPPLRRSSPKRLLSLALSALVGLMAGIGCAFFLDSLDSTLSTVAAIERYLKLPNLAIVPDYASLNGHRRQLVTSSAGLLQPDNLPVLHSEMLAAPLSNPLLVEAYRALQTALMFSRPDSPPKTILFSSACSGEGKTLTTLNSALSFAGNGAKVLVIDADFRRSTFLKILDLPNGSGLADLLVAHKQISEVIRSVVPGRLSFICGGAAPPNPGALLGSQTMRDLLETLKPQYDYILIDSCPILPVSDAVLLSRSVDAVVFVVNGGSTPGNLAQQAVVRLNRAHAPVVGTVLNQVDIRHGRDAYYYREQFSYYDDETEPVSDSVGNRNGNHLPT